MELVFIGIYFTSNAWVKSRNLEALRATAHDELRRIVGREALVIERQLSRIEFQAELFRRQVAVALEIPHDMREVDTVRMVHAPGGIWHSVRNREDGSGAALFFSGRHPLTAGVKERIGRIATLQPLMKNLKDAEPLTTAIYFNTHDSFNIIYPYIDSIRRLPARMDLPAWSFYYEADRAHNPTRGIRWTRVYKDPAGNGWMASCIAPVYRGDFLEGVVGLDITVDTLARQVLNLRIPWDGYGVLIDREVTIMAVPEGEERAWGLEGPAGEKSMRAVQQEVFKPERFNLHRRPDLQALADRLDADVGRVRLELDGRWMIAAWATAPATGWKLLVLIPEASIYANANALSETLHQIGWLMLVGLVVFYLCFFSVLYLRTRRMARLVARPLQEVNAMMRRVGQGDYFQRRRTFPVQELDETAGLLVEMGQQLGEADARRREMENSIIRARESAEKANQAKSEFLSQMSHELRTPMNAILGFAQLLEFDPAEPLTENQQASVQEILKAGHHLLELINDVLDLARIESGRYAVSIEPVEAGPLLDESLALVQGMADARGVTVIDRSGLIARELVLADRTRLKAVLVNLLSNAVKYNRERGSVTLSGELIRERRLRLSVIDTGIGIPAELQSSIFEPFFRIRDDSTVEGAGIGLTVARRLVELMGGTMGVESRVGVGSHFWVELPLAEEVSGVAGDAPCPAGAVRHLDQPCSRRFTVLYVEDHPANRGLVQRLLSIHPSIRVLTADTPETGLRLARFFRLDLVLLDLNLPGMSGFELLRQLRAMPSLEHLPAIAVSANAMPRDIEAGLAAGFTHYIAKPLVVSTFLRVVESCLGIDPIDLRDNAA